MSSSSQQEETSTHVCVIGAGVCGLMCIKTCLESGLKVTCYERSSKYGGLWNYRPDNQDDDGPIEPSVMKTTILNTSKELSAFSDFPPPAQLAVYMRHTHYMNYIHSYLEHFKLQPHLNLEHLVISCRPEWRRPKIQTLGGGGGEIKWLVRVKCLKTNKEFIREFDRLMVAVGHHNIPYTPSYDGQDRFKGKILHSSRLKDILSDQKLINKRVLVVGFGNSACDAAVDISMVAQKCYISSHRGQWLTGRFNYAGPVDYRVKNRMYYYATKWFPRWLMGWIAISKLERGINHEMLGLKPKHTPSELVPAINDLMPSRIYTGLIVLKGSIERLTENGVVFEGEAGEECPIDVIVLATGYEARISFLDEVQLGIKSLEHKNEYDLFMNIFAPRLTLPEASLEQVASDQVTTNDCSKVPSTDNTYQLPTPIETIKSLAFVGLVQPHGAMTVIAELQARYACLVFNGQKELPKMSTMFKHIDRMRRLRSGSIITHSKDQLIGNYIGYLETISAMIGVRPNLKKLFFTDHELWRHLLFGPNYPYQYRLSGPNCWPEARQTILTASERFEQGINEGKNPLLYKLRRKRLNERDDGKSLKTKNKQ